MGSWNMQEYWDSDLLCLGHGRICKGFSPFSFWRHAFELATFFIVQMNWIFWNASLKLRKNLATLNPKKLQGFHSSPLSHCYTLPRTAVFSTHVVCASARLWSLPRGLLPSQHRRRCIVFRVLFQQTNKQEEPGHALWTEFHWICTFVGTKTPALKVRDSLLDPKWQVGFSATIKGGERVGWHRPRKKGREALYRGSARSDGLAGRERNVNI